MIHNTQPNNNRLAFADGLRGLAALWVVLFHIAEGHHIESIKAAIPSYLFTPIFEYGHLGVAIFFVLSGFVMGLTACNVIFDRKNALKFISRRLLRLAPPYYFAIVVALLFLFIKSKATGATYSPPDLNTLLNHLVFTQSLFNIPHINIVFWTLCIEVQFYVAFALILWICDTFKHFYNQPYIRLLIMASISMLALLWPLRIIQSSIWQGGFLGFWYSFLAGVIVCWATLEKKMFLKFTVFFCISLLIIGLLYSDSFAIAASVTASTLLFAGLKNQMKNWLNWSWIQWLGIVSYSLYLLHNPITGATANITKRIVPAGIWSDIAIMITTIFACLITAKISYIMIELPSIRLSHLIKLKK